MSILSAMRVFRSSAGPSEFQAIHSVYNACSDRERMDCEDLDTVFASGVFDDDQTPRAVGHRYYHVQTIVAQVGLRGIVSAVADFHVDRTAIVIRQVLVHPQCRRCALGSGLLREMKHNSSISKRGLRVFVPECQTGVLLFLQQNGFKSRRHVAGRYVQAIESVGQEYIRMEWP